MLVRYNQSTALTETLNPSVFLSVEGGNHGLDGISLLDPYGAHSLSLTHTNHSPVAAVFTQDLTVVCGNLWWWAWGASCRLARHYSGTPQEHVCP
jgi:hypothetical protein